MVSSYIWMDSTVQELSNDTKNTKFEVRTKKLCKLQSIEDVQYGEATGSPQRTRKATNEDMGSPQQRTLRHSEGRTAQQPILAIFEDLYKGGHVLGLRDERERTKSTLLRLAIGSFEGENPP